MKGIKELSDMLARSRGISKKEATSIMTDVVEIMGEAIAHDGGVSIKGVFTIKTKTRPARSGTMKGVEWHSPEKRVLTIKSGTQMDKELNPKA